MHLNRIMPELQEIIILNCGYDKEKCLLGKCTSWHLDGAHYLYGVCRFLSVLFKQQHGGSIHVDVELLLDTRGLAMIYVPKPHKVPICERRELQAEQHNRGFCFLPTNSNMYTRAATISQQNRLRCCWFIEPGAKACYNVKLHSPPIPIQELKWESCNFFLN